ncbi:hypothetical protein [Piscinibacter gummiphilus]|uniref:Uncharacterized protein n=1 Tax=Piscinibacter gummiphilus TaxID=946333 RepID=A0A1W6LE56_9BURK|nr:hypothetical protein [Piscinibacter gummiphilus]ARN22507.1 hypothetical protein A4W93_22785 [Piscinibacter gummiphilus]ATU67201.1 hypothetical protein CPZ87_22915 [Piscinibacter gummiphilus]GLS98093.1 hypothetical protein GCM10007918_53850 [Piscinibacter gummiphilus]
MRSLAVQFDRSKVKNINEYAAVADVGTPGFLKLSHGAREYVCSLAWVKRVQQIFVGRVFGDRAAVFLYETVPVKRGVDRFHWIVWGDVPAAYLVLDDAPDPDSAVDAYLYEVRNWIAAVRGQESLPDVMPIDWAKTREGADQLEQLIEEVFGR